MVAPPASEHGLLAPPALELGERDRARVIPVELGDQDLPLAVVDRHPQLLDEDAQLLIGAADPPISTSVHQYISTSVHQ
jgi:hypothetical protein